MSTGRASPDRLIGNPTNGSKRNDHEYRYRAGRTARQTRAPAQRARRPGQRRAIRPALNLNVPPRELVYLRVIMVRLAEYATRPGTLGMFRETDPNVAR